MTESLIRPPAADGFTTESPLRAFTEFMVQGRYAVGRGFRPSLQHLTLYLDAIETKEHWQLIQLVLDGQGKPSAAIFRHASPTLTELAAPAAFLGSITAEDVSRYDDDSCPACHGLNTSCPEGCAVPVDDPVNPKHYGGTACAEIGERLTANCYQVLKYCWRVGEKGDPVTDLKKALWYLDREKNLGLHARPTMTDGTNVTRVKDLCAGRSEFTQEVAILCHLISYAVWRPSPTKGWNADISNLRRLIEKEIENHGK